MGLRRIIQERDFFVLGRILGDWLRGWSEKDCGRLSQRLYDPAAYSGGILRITKREARALPELNRRALEGSDRAMLYPFLAWVEGRGLQWLMKAA
ncbi:hypothetical protein [Bradyrhizobium sp.]|jgi:hypothetical protein|uniref:hypothetical protein n=1 Tax=Bradyrhizobium sp. TaxID=376 RepID=UPI003C29190F